jgi:ArsR family transcriptional regulator
MTEAIDAEKAVRLAEVFAALADPSRLRIISALAHNKLSVGQICEIVGMSQPAVSHHLRLLRVQHVVRAAKEGRQVYYSLDDQHIHDLLDRGLAHIDHV